MRNLLVVLAMLLTTAAGLARGDDDPFKDWTESYLTGTVRDEDGKPIKGAKVHPHKAHGPYATGDSDLAITGDDDKYSLRVFVKPDNKVVVTEVIVSAKGFVQM